MDFYRDNPLYADPLFTPASTAPRPGMRGNTLFEDTPGGDAAAFTGGTAFGAPGFGSAAAPRSAPQRQRRSGFFDPDPRLFDPAAEAPDQDMLRGEQQAIEPAVDAPEPPTATASALVPSPAGISRIVQLSVVSGNKAA